MYTNAYVYVIAYVHQSDKLLHGEKISRLHNLYLLSSQVSGLTSERKILIQVFIAQELNYARASYLTSCYTVVLKLESPLESPGKLAQPQTSGSHSQNL